MTRQFGFHLNGNGSGGVWLTTLYIEGKPHQSSLSLVCPSSYLGGPGCQPGQDRCTH